ncbi:MAG TPA: RMD1 family protein [Turneriella sp.]|nr:RMD1 family protein [Turneriella sp.]
MNVNAYSLAESIDLAAVARRLGRNPIAQTNREMFFSEGRGFFGVYSFGAVVFCNLNPADEVRLREYATGAAQNQHTQILAEDHTIKTGRLAFVPSEITVPKTDAATLRVIMQNLAYSVSLDHYRRVAAELLAVVRGQSENLERKGKITLKERELHHFIGRVLNIRNRMTEHFHIFGNPPEAWENKALTAVQQAMVASLEMPSRIAEVESSFAIIEENLHMLNELHVHRQSHRIEIIITLLILIEVLDLIGDKLKIFH